MFADEADNGCDAIGLGILEDGKTLGSIGSFGLFFSNEASEEKYFGGEIHYFNHDATDAF